ncbi:winged helix-turn-helix domain-containing protein [Klebsiella aerogenes]|nr:winged helix-turn-helix domain-containing protein [Klebsiella aerogenes]
MMISINMNDIQATEGAQSERTNENTPSYILGDFAIFTPSQRLLKSLKTNKTVVLQTPANYCLKLLLINKERMLSKDELIVYAWGEKFSGVITNNNFYQAMHHLRKSLKDIGCPDFIITTPRKGLSIDPKLNISIYNKSDSFSKSEESNSKVHTKYKVSKPNIIFLLSIIIVITIPSYFMIYHRNRQNAFDNYKKTVLNKCNIYEKDSYETDMKMAIINSNRINCQKRNDIYIAINEHTQRSSVITCSYDSDNHRRCNSLIKIGAM